MGLPNTSHAPIPKLNTRVRFPSSAPSPQAGLTFAFKSLSQPAELGPERDSFPSIRKRVLGHDYVRLMSELTEQHILGLVPLTISFSPDTVPMREIVARGTTKDDSSVERAMRYLAQKLPFQIGQWPDFGESVHDNVRVKVFGLGIDVQWAERGQVRSSPTANTFPSAFVSVLDHIAPTHSVEAAATLAAAAKPTVRGLSSWLGNASRVKHMYEVNGVLGLSSAEFCLGWMCQELVQMEAYSTMERAVAAESTLVHALCLGGIPKAFASDIYQQVLGGLASADAIDHEAITVTQRALDDAGADLIVESNAGFISRQLAVGVSHDELSKDALRSYYIARYLRDFSDGGFARFVHNSGWDRSINTLLREGLQAIGATWHLRHFDRAAENVEDLGDQRLRRFLTGTTAVGHDTITQQIAKQLNRVDGQIAAEERTNSLTVLNAAWLRNHPKLDVLTPQQMAEEMARQTEANRGRSLRCSQADLRTERLIRALCEKAGQEPDDLTKPARGSRFHRGRTLPAWHFTIDGVESTMLDIGDEALLFDTSTTSPRCRIDADEDPFRPGINTVDELIPQFIDMIATADAIGIEAGRDDVEPHHVEPLIAHYDTLTSWLEKQSFVELVQDQTDVRLRPVMLDFLRASAFQREAMDQMRSSALGFIDSRFDERRDLHAADPALLDTDVAAALAEHG